MKKLFFFLVLGSYLLTQSAFCETSALIDSNRVRQLVLSKMEAYGIPGMQVCIKPRLSGQAVNFSLGVANIESKKPVTNDTQFKIGSNTKSFTAMGILSLSHKGRIQLNDPISRHLSNISPKYRDITIEELMNMNSGLRGYINDDRDYHIVDQAFADPDRHFSPEELVQYGFRLTDNQGMTDKNQFHYTNTNYILLGMIIESATKMPYAEFIQQEIIAPLGLQHTYVPEDNRYDDNVSSGYHFDKAEMTTENYSELDLSYIWSAGAIISTAADLCRWVTLVGTDAVFYNNRLDYLKSGTPIGGTVHYTSGLINEPDMLWHNGTVPGYHGEMRYLKKEQTAIVVLANCTIGGIDSDPVNEVIDEIARLIVDRLKKS